MKNNTAIILICISAVLFLLSMITGVPQWFGLCDKWDFDCQFSYRENFMILGWLVLIAPPFFLLGLMSWVKNKSEKVFMAWWKFARVYIPIALILIVLSDGGGALSGLGAGGGFDREITIWVTAVIFFLVTFILLPLKFKTYKNA